MVWKPVHAETATPLAPLVVGDPVREVSGGVFKIFAIDPPEEVITGMAAVTSGPIPFILVTAARANQPALRVLGALGNDVDHAVHGIGAPKGAARPANDLDPLNIL